MRFISNAILKVIYKIKNIFRKIVNSISNIIKIIFKPIKDNKFFIFLSISLTIIIIVMAVYISNLLFVGKNSYGVYIDLKYKKRQLENNIQKIQLENAKLQKQYLELKNLEPEEL